MSKRKTIFYFGYSWKMPVQLDAYQSSLVQSFREEGCDVHVFYSNLLAKENSLYGIQPSFEKSMVAKIKKQKPDIIISMNQGFLSEQICSAAPRETQIFTWIVDDPAHLFFPNRKAEELDYVHSLPSRVKVIVSSTDLQKYFLENCSNIKAENIIFLSSVTDFKRFTEVPFRPRRNIVFVGSFLDCSLGKRILTDIVDDPYVWKLMLEILKKMEEGYSDDYKEYQDEAIVSLVSRHEITMHQFKVVMSNLVSSKLRLLTVKTLQPLGIEVYGNVDGWIEGSALDTDVLSCIQGRKISSRSDLVEIYQTSKIAVQIPQVQVGPALSFRVFDIMASGCMLMHPYRKDSDLYYTFGADCPVPTYDSMSELHEKCQYYLDNEEARKEVVSRCQDLVRDGFSFKDRIQFFIGRGAGDDKTKVNDVMGDLIDYKKPSEINFPAALLLYFRYAFFLMKTLLKQYYRMIMARR